MNNYQVKEGDTLSRIALDNKININDILTANPSIESPDKIYAGSTIVIPQVSTPVKPVTMPESRVVNIEDVQQAQPKMEIPQVENQDTYYTRYLNSLQKDIAPIQTNLAPLYEAEALAMQNLTQKGQETARLQEEAGLSAQQQQLRDLQNQINQQSLKFTAGQYNLSAAGNPITANVARKNDALQLAMLTASASYMQGNILGIQDSIQKAIDLKYNDIETGLYFTQQLITRNENLLSEKQKEQAQLRNMLIDTELKRVNEDKSMIRDLLINAAQQGADPAILSEASQKNTPEDVARVLGTWAGDYWKIKELKDKYNLDNYGNYGVSTYPIGSLTKESGMTVDDYIKGIAGVESGGEELPYQAKGVIVTTGMYKGDRAYGKYQVMGKNIPSWTKEAFGKAMTIEEFLNSPEKQEQLIRFRAEKDYAKYGNWDDVASVWFSGRPLANNVSADVTGTTVPEYINRFRKQAGIGNETTTSPLDNISPEAKSWVSLYNAGTMELGDILTKLGTSKEASTLKNEISGAIAAQGGKRVYGQDQDTVQAIQQQISNIKKLRDDLKWQSISGPVKVGMFGKKGDAITYANLIVSSQTLQALADAKSKGITFGALSEKELQTVAASASALAARQKEDGTFRGTEKEFKNDLDTLLIYLQKSIQSKTNNATSPEQTTDDIINILNSVDVNQIKYNQIMN